MGGGFEMGQKKSISKATLAVSVGSVQKLYFLHSSKIALFTQ